MRSASPPAACPRRGEAVADAQFFPVDSIGKKIVLSETNDEDTLDMFAYREYTIVGLEQLPPPTPSTTGAAAPPWAPAR